MSGGSLAYFWGEDSFALEQAARALAAEVSAAGMQPAEVWRTGTADDEAVGAAAARAKTLEKIEQRVTTSPLFGGGTVVIVRQPGPLLAESTARARLIGLLPQVGPGNALCFLDLVSAGSKGLPANNRQLHDAVAASGGTVTEFPVPTRERMEGWVDRRARELGVTLGPGAAKAIAERVGAFVREGDVDRRRQSELANAELEKLALYRPGGTVTSADVESIVSEAVPGSTWAFLDALGVRNAGATATLADRLLASGTALPLLITQIHRRLRELIIVRDHMDAGTRPPDLVKALKMQPFRVQKLAEQASRWDATALQDALEGLLELDLLSKGIAADGSPHSVSEDRSKLALMAWIGERVGGRGGSATRPRSGSVGA